MPMTSIIATIFLHTILTPTINFVRVAYLKVGQIVMLKAYQYRIYPKAMQKNLLALHFGHTRHVYNWALKQKIQHYEECKKSLPRSELQKRLVGMKKTEKPWLREVNSQSLLAALFQLDTAFQNFFQGRAGFPKLKKKYDGHQSFQCPQHVTVDFVAGLLNLPKIKAIKIKLHRTFNGNIKTVTVKKVPTGKYFVSILVDNQKALPVATVIEPDKTMGLDMGLSHYLISSNGDKVLHPTYLKKTLRQLGCAQRQLSRKKTNDSKNRAKQKGVVAKLHEAVSNRRHDFVHQLSARLVFKNHETSFAVEDLHIKGMVKNRKLSRAIADSGWRKFINVLTYKCEWHSKNVLKIGRFAASSKTCNACKIKRKELPLQVREWRCECGVLHDRDINAACNIRAFALADALGQSVCVKQFPCS
jgi:putative transposase